MVTTYIVLLYISYSNFRQTLQSCQNQGFLLFHAHPDWENTSVYSPEKRVNSVFQRKRKWKGYMNIPKNRYSPRPHFASKLVDFAVSRGTSELKRGDGVTFKHCALKKIYVKQCFKHSGELDAEVSIRGDKTVESAILWEGASHNLFRANSKNTGFRSVFRQCF